MMWPSSQASKMLTILLALIVLYCLAMDALLFLRIRYYKIDLYDEVFETNGTRQATEATTGGSLPSYESVVWVPCDMNPLCYPTVKALLVDHVNHYLYGPLSAAVDLGLHISHGMPFITPNMISFFHVFVAFVGAKLLTCQSLTTRRVGIVLFQLRMFLDDLDGHVARERKHIKGEKSEVGTLGYWVDGICDLIGVTAMMAGIVLYLRSNPPRRGYRNTPLSTLPYHQLKEINSSEDIEKEHAASEYLLEVGHRVCVTQPRVSAALTLAARVAHERGCLPGHDVGYAVSMGTCRSPHTGIVFVTEGVLLREMFASPLLTQYSCIVLDEAHERSQLTDVLLGLLKKIARKRKNLKIVVSSATMDAEFLKEFFTSRAGAAHCRAAVLSVRGRTHPVQVFYAEDPVADYVRATVDTVIKIHENEPFGDVLAFLTSQEEILTALENLSSYAEENNDRNKHRKHFPSGITAADMLVLPMYGSLPHHRQVKVFQMAGGNTRKVVLATNIAETSVTIPGIVYVVDCGFQKLPYMDPALGVEWTAVAPVARSNALQRTGRCGRTAPGKCYRLYTEEDYERLAPCVPPELARSDLSAALLQLKALGIHNLLRFTFPTPPPAKALLAGLELLYALGALSPSGALTPLGERMAELPLRPMLAKVLCTSGEYGCMEEALTIASMLQVEGVFTKAGGTKENLAARISKRNNFEVAEGDIIMYLNVYEGYERVRRSYGDEKRRRRACRDWCARRHVSGRAMDKICEIRNSLEKLVKQKFNIENVQFEGPDLGSGKCERVMKCVLSGLFPQAARLHVDGAYRSVRGAALHVSPDSCLYNALQPSWVVFGSVQSASGRTYMRDLMAVRKEWLLEVAPHYYKET